MNKMIIARKYAQAFLQYGSFDSESISFAIRLDGLVEFLGCYRDRLFHSGKDIYLAILVEFGFDKKLFGLFLDLLIRDKRLCLLKKVFKNMSSLYKKKNNIEFCVITSSHVLSEKQKQELHAFLERSIGKKIMYSYAVNRSLIAGIRARATSFIWEDSIAQKLRTIGQSY